MNRSTHPPVRRLHALPALVTSVLVSAACGTAAPAPQPPAPPRQEFKAPPPSKPDPEHNLIKNSHFDGVSMLPWMASLTSPAHGQATLQDHALCLHLEAPGANPWDAQLRHREMTVKKGLNYAVQFKAWATRPTKATVKVGMSGPPYTDYWNRALELTTEPKEFSFNFTMWQPDDPTVEFAFHWGGSNLRGEGPIDVCLDDLILANPEFTPPPAEDAPPTPAIRVNQVGYLPTLPKLAVLVQEGKAGLEWQLLDQAGEELAKGKTKPLNLDPASGDTLQLIDFSAYAAEGRGLQLTVGEAVSDRFAIGSDLYATMKYDAFKYFYYNRSGVEISKKFTARDDLARPAGHPKDVAPCAPDIGCKYSLDVTGGWYDAGDYGKYVVNGGISVWTLMNWYERSVHLRGADRDAFADGKAGLPESGNAVPDVLDEARWELEFMLRMQVPEGEKLDGMVHHKMHDVGSGPRWGSRRTRAVSSVSCGHRARPRR